MAANTIYTRICTLHFTGPVMNSACPWATDEKDLNALYNSPYTGGVTTRTATEYGFKEDTTIHQHAFTPIASLNNYGYSPYPLSRYLIWIRSLLQNSTSPKPIIISITSSRPSELAYMINSIQLLRRELGDPSAPNSRIGIELNTSCPNIADKPPPSYDARTLLFLLHPLVEAVRKDPTLTVGIKLPPYVIPSQFTDVLNAIQSLQTEGEEQNPIAFLTCTNTLGGCLITADEVGMKRIEGKEWALAGGYGGMGGSALHAASLGNVHRFSNLIDNHPSLPMRQIAIIGVGGVSDSAGVKRMQAAGATMVECATALGRFGVEVFEKMQV
ncbi:FMN-linked oxidoreductase [Dacryopinax primogenitus]|uniref:Dihydroorotate oxidase n=1 Tax=Dacryopinax primogenitus (strain DJM 731) TaxID=1858805 RepID=M5GCH8_DACPD|nr:FMN-linked oxidoreductase [Dacryopinax primogenitus]EJU01783.1 FMN-linked oxidoreductase [Dacryopinax primogenitus]